MGKTEGEGNLMASNPLWTMQLRWWRTSPHQGWETWRSQAVTKQDYLSPGVEGTEDSTDSDCQAWLEQLLSMKGTQSPVCSPFQRSVLPWRRQVSRAGYDRPSTREQFQMLLLAAVCVKELRQWLCQERVHALARVHWQGSGGSQGQQVLAETKHAGAEEGNLCKHR